MGARHRLRQHFLNATEPVRLLRDYLNFKDARADIIAETPQGDGHPVIVIPGFGGNDKFYQPLINLLNEKGYSAYGWENGIHYSLNEENAKHLAEHILDISRKHGGQPVTLIGHSLGGFDALTLPQEIAEIVRDIYTGGTPFRIDEFPDAAPSFLVHMIEGLSSDKFSLSSPDIGPRLRTPPKDRPAVTFYSPGDGIADKRACQHPVTPLTANHEVDASHMGIFLHPDTLRYLLHYLPQQPGQWKPHPDAEKETPVRSAGWKPPKGNDWRFYPQLKI